MRILPEWIAEFVDLPPDFHQLAEDLTHAGIAVESVEGRDAESIYEMDVTTNRVDAMNHYGIAREASAIYDRDLKPLTPKLAPPQVVGEAFPIDIQRPDLCARFTAQVIRNVKVGRSSSGVLGRFARLGQKPINNIADATNYVLLMMGHPTHAFDLDRLEGRRIVVRQAQSGEKLRTLDGVERTLHADDLVVADAVRPVGLAGVMGGWDTMITENTVNVLVEAAWFDPAAVRRSSRRHGIHTDASHRFERGADWNAAPLASALVSEIILAAGGVLEGGLVDVRARRLERASVVLRMAEIERILGQNVPEKDLQRILTRLGCAFEVAGKPPISLSASGSGDTAIAEDPSVVSVRPPSWRLDVEREIDLIEEIARVYGFNNFENRLPSFSGVSTALPHAEAHEKVRRMLLALGYNEAISSSFVSSSEAICFASREPVALENPLNEEAAFLRTSLLPGMLNMVGYNLNRSVDTAKLFESGSVFARLNRESGGEVAQHRALALGAYGQVEQASIHGPGREYGFYDLKGNLEEILGRFGGNLSYDDDAPDFLQPGRSARVLLDGRPVGCFGQLHGSIADDRRIKVAVFVAEIDLDGLYSRPLRTIQYRKVSRFPAVDRDFSFLFDDEVHWQRIADSILGLRIPNLRSFEPKELFRGTGVPAGKYSLLMHALFQSTDRTLRDDEVQLWSMQIIRELEALGGVIRA